MFYHNCKQTKLTYKMKRIIAVFLTLWSIVGIAQTHNYQSGEFLKFRVHYMGVNAGFATLSVKDATFAGKPHFHVVGKGSTSGVSKMFFKVNDTYETYINKSTSLPSKFIRNINEGGYTKNLDMMFNHSAKSVVVNDKKAGKSTTYKFTGANMQDMLSSFYYLRDYDTSKLKIGDFINIKMFMDEEEYTFKLKMLGKEVVKTKWGKINCLKVRPYVAAGRVFKEQESLTVWITDDKNHIPVNIKASLMVGSIQAELYEYKGVKNSLTFSK
mgnify:CR=1 FL=1